MTCQACGVANEAGRRFCRECGERLAVLCASCGSANSPTDKFCGECGVSLTTTAVTAVRESSTERRVVSVLFVDLVGFTAYSEGRDAEDVRTMLTRYFDAASDAVQRHGGTVEKFIGDAVMAVWGTPVAHEDDAERAVRSALEIVDRVRALGVSLGVDLAARAGVLTGEAVAALDAVGQGIVTGDLVNTASRLQSAAAPGTVLVGEGTFRSVSSSIAFQPVQPLVLKGKSEPVAAWLALRVTGELGGSGRGNAPEPPFGGRDEDLRLAKELLHATGREGRPRLLHITGVAGIGKSRLVWELQKYVDGLTEEFLWHQGRCPSYGDGVSFWALAEMVRGRARITDTDDDATARAALDTCLEEYVADVDERRWLEPRLSHLIGLGGTSGDRDELFGAWRRFFERLAERGTVVLVFEDLQWADPGLMDFVESLLEWSRTSPVIVLSQARPELADRRPTWGSGARSSSTLHLDRLADSDIEVMVTGYVDGLPAGDLARLVSRSEGVPLYAVETVRMLASRGVLEEHGLSYVLVGDLGGELDVPETLHALVAARLDTLPETERALVQDASVVGQTFSLATVGAVSGRTAHEVEQVLRTLVRKEVLDQDVDPRSAERGQYRFVQSVIQEVAYSTLSKGARRARHLACARWLESLAEDDLAGVVAHHYLDAYRSEPSAADAEDIASHARQWLVRAAERAASLGSPEQALSYALQGLTLATSPVDRAQLHALAARGADNLGDKDTLWQHLQAGAADYDVLGDLVGAAHLLQSPHVLMNIRREHLQEFTERREDVERRLPDDRVAERVSLLVGLAASAAHAGDTGTALAYSERAIVLAQGLLEGEGDAVLRDAAGNRAYVLHLVGRHLESRLLLEAVLAMARRSGSPVSLARALMTLGVALTEDDPRASYEFMIECAAVAKSAGMRPMESLAQANAAEGAVDLGEWDTADELMANLRQMSRDEEDGAVLTGAMLLAYRSEPADALAMLEEVRMRYDQQWDQVTMHTWFLRARSLVRYLAGDPTGGLADSLHSLELDAGGDNAPVSVWTAVHSGAAVGDTASLELAVATTSGLRGQWISMVRSTARAAISALQHEDGAEAAMASAAEAWSAAGLPLDHAHAALCALHVLPDAETTRTHAAQARAFVEQLPSPSLLRLFDAAMP